MRVCIIGPTNLRYMPFLASFEDVLKGNGAEYDILYWDRYGLKERHERAIGLYRPDLRTGAAVVSGYVAFRRFVLGHLSKGRYDVCIVTSTQAAVLLFDVLQRRRFILDIRDFSHENLFPFRFALGLLLRKAAFVSISSEGFLEWLPRGPQYVLSHNIGLGGLARRPAEFPEHDFIASYIGSLNYLRANLMFVASASGIPGLEIRYVGEALSVKELEEFCRARQLSNVRFLGEFDPAEKDRYYHETNFTISCYGNDTMVVRTALPNRLYESCVQRRPIIVNTGTFLAKVVKENQIGIVVDLDQMDSLGGQMREYYDTGFRESYDSHCADYLRSVERQNIAFKERLAEELQR
jgi:hypothetical protein